MGTKEIILNIFIIISSIGLLNFTGCKKPCENFHYNFKGTALFYPEKDSVKVGDTVWFTSTIPSQILNQNNNQIVDYSGASNFSTDIHLNVLSGVNSVAGAADSFNYILIKGSIKTHSITPHSAKTISYLEESGAYNSVFGIVALNKGVYAIAVVDIKNSRKKCSDATITLTLSNIEKHQYYLRSIYYPGSPYGESIPVIEQTHTYCFKVY